MVDERRMIRREGPVKRGQDRRPQAMERSIMGNSDIGHGLPLRLAYGNSQQNPAIAGQRSSPDRKTCTNSAFRFPQGRRRTRELVMWQSRNCPGQTRGACEPCPGYADRRGAGPGLHE